MKLAPIYPNRLGKIIGSSQAGLSSLGVIVWTVISLILGLP